MKRFMCLFLSMLMLISVSSVAGSQLTGEVLPKAAATGLTVDFSFTTPMVGYDGATDTDYYYYVRTVDGVIVPYVSIGKRDAAMEVMGYTSQEQLIADEDIAVIYQGGYRKASEAPAEILTADKEYYLFNYVHLGNYYDCIDAGYTHDQIVDEIYCYLEPTNDVPGYYHANVIIGDTIPEDTQFFIPRKIAPSVKVPTGSYFSFIVVTNQVFNVATARIEYTKGSFSGMMELNINKEYVMYADEDANFDLIEQVGDEKILLRNRFKVLIASGDGYKVMPVVGRNQIVYYGEDYYFKVRLLDGYTDSGMSVYVARGEDDLSAYIGEDISSLRGMLGDEGVELLTVSQVDADGNKIYCIKNITTNVNISVSGVNKSSFADLLTIFKRILKLIFDAFGLDSSRLGLLNIYNVTINCDNRVNSCVVAQGSDDAGARNFEVMSGTNIALLITKSSMSDNVTVRWTPGNENGTAFTPYTDEDDQWLLNENGLPQAMFYIDNITADTTIDILYN